MSGAAAVQLPILGANGRIRAYALIDLADVERFAAVRWSYSHGYVVRLEREAGMSRSFRLHREVLGLDPADRREPDHINGDPLDNRRCNLRAVTHQENAQNHRARRARDGHSVPTPQIVATLSVPRSRRGDPNGGQWAGSLESGQIEDIRRRRALGERGVDLAAEFGISPQLVCDIVKGRKYGAAGARCSNCGRLAVPLRRGCCKACSAYLARTGLDRPYATEDGRMVRTATTCSTCGRLYKPLRKGRCKACDKYLRSTGRERPYIDDGRQEKAR